MNLQAQIEGDLIAMLDEWHSLPEVWDNELDSQIHEWYANVEPVYPKRPYFSPSAADACPRELYMKAIGADRDKTKQQPHQGRWQRIGTAIGGVIQRDILFIEKHFDRITGNKPPFVFERTPDGRPMFEDFAKKNHLVEWGDERFYLYGAPDGIMRYTTDDGEVIRVGLEIKSKQTTPAKTSLHSMIAPDYKHAKQVVAYSAMFDCDYYVILYVNAAKQAWEVTDEQYEKTPDMRAFCLHINDDDRAELFDRLAGINRAVRERKPPKLDIDKFTFNNYKTACALSLTDEEFDEIKAYVKRALRSRLPEWRKQAYYDAFEFIREVREQRDSEEG